MNTLEYAGESDVGRSRRENQDRWFADVEEGLFLVADGMGGSLAGKLAADIVVEVLPRLIQQRLRGCASLKEPGAAPRVVEALAEMSQRLHDEGQRRFGRNGIGSTVVLALVRRNRALLAHLGDSRAYLLHNGRLKLLTRDDSVVQAIVDSGALSAEEATHHPARCQLTQFIGMQGEPSPRTQVVYLSPGDRLLLCSDGLHGMVDHKRMETIVAGKNCSAEICEELISAAKKAGGKDNVTALVVTLGSRK